MSVPQGAEPPSERDSESPRPIRAEAENRDVLPPGKAGGSGPEPDLTSAGKVVDALKASADQEFNIAERVSAKSRQAFALAAGFFIVGQTVAFGSFEATKLSNTRNIG